MTTHAKSRLMQHVSLQEIIPLCTAATPLLPGLLQPGVHSPSPSAFTHLKVRMQCGKQSLCELM